MRRTQQRSYIKHTGTYLSRPSRSPRRQLCGVEHHHHRLWLWVEHGQGLWTQPGFLSVLQGRRTWGQEGQREQQQQTCSSTLSPGWIFHWAGWQPTVSSAALPSQLRHNNMHSRKKGQKQRQRTRCAMELHCLPNREATGALRVCCIFPFLTFFFLFIFMKITLRGKWKKNVERVKNRNEFASQGFKWTKACFKWF